MAKFGDLTAPPHGRTGGPGIDTAPRSILRLLSMLGTNEQQPEVWKRFTQNLCRWRIKIIIRERTLQSFQVFMLSAGPSHRSMFTPIQVCSSLCWNI